MNWIAEGCLKNDVFFIINSQPQSADGRTMGRACLEFADSCLAQAPGRLTGIASLFLQMSYPGSACRSRLRSGFVARDPSYLIGSCRRRNGTMLIPFLPPCRFRPHTPSEPRKDDANHCKWTRLPCPAATLADLLEQFCLTSRAGKAAPGSPLAQPSTASLCLASNGGIASSAPRPGGNSLAGQGG